MTLVTTTTGEPSLGTDGVAIRPFRFEAAPSDLDDLRRSDRRRPAGRSGRTWTTSRKACGSGRCEALARYWATGYDWRTGEPGSTRYRSSSPRSTGSRSTSSTSARSTRTRCRCSSFTAGRARSSSTKIIGPLTDPRRTAAGPRMRFTSSARRCRASAFRASRRSRAGIRTRSGTPGLKLMKRLGYSRFVAHGGDWGAMVSRW